MATDTKGFLPYVLHGHSRPINSLCFNEDSDLLCAACTDNTCTVWWTHNATPARVFHDDGAITSVALTGFLVHLHTRISLL